MNSHFIDSHAHLTSDDATYEDVHEILRRSQEAGINQIVNICTGVESLKRGLKLADAYPYVHNTASTTPHDVEKDGEEAFPFIAETAREKRLKAIGETGLDYHYAHSKPEIQQTFLRRYLQLALECDLPVIIHCRDAFADFFKILDEEYKINGKHAPGVLHCFTGTMQEAEEVIKRGWYLSLSGIVTFKKSDILKEVAKFVPINQLLIETDTPYLAPQSKRGKTNEPTYLPEIAACIASLKGISIDEVAAATSNNARTLFGI